MKLYFDKRLKDPTYYAQQGIRNGKKTTTKNVRNFGKHSELLKITDDEAFKANWRNIGYFYLREIMSGPKHWEFWKTKHSGRFRTNRFFNRGGSKPGNLPGDMAIQKTKSVLHREYLYIDHTS